jgi:hypothetical protein
MAEVAPGRQAITSREVDNLFRIGKLKRATAADEEIVGRRNPPRIGRRTRCRAKETWRFRGGRL